jgi:hypothetical protein
MIGCGARLEAPPRPLRGRCARVVRYETEMISIGMDYDPGHETIEMLMGKTLDKVTGGLRYPDRERRLYIAARLIPGEMTGPNDHALWRKGAADCAQPRLKRCLPSLTRVTACKPNGPSINTFV